MSNTNREIWSLKSLEEGLVASGYTPRRRELLAVAGTLAAQGKGARAMLLEGPPGAGKSFLAESLAELLEATFIPYQCHSWTDADEMFVGVNVVAAVAGDSEGTRQDGVLALAAKASQEGFVVLLVDEIDKAPQRAEDLFLDWLQSGRVPVAPGVHLQTVLDNVLVCFTSNGQRELGIAFPRRVRRVFMESLPLNQQLEWLQARTHHPQGVVKVAWKLAREIAAEEGNSDLSLQEGHRLLGELDFCESHSDVVEVVASWAARTPSGFNAAQKKQTKQRIAALWALLKT